MIPQISQSIEMDADRAPEPIGAHWQAVERVLAAMRERVDDSLPLTSMAEIAHLSPYHFIRVFRQAVGSPPGEFLTALRLERAKRLLLTTDLSVTDVCFEVGYNSLGTFTTRYTQLVGLPPGRTRYLYDEVGFALERWRESSLDLLSHTPKGGGISGRIIAPSLTGSLIFVGLFPSAIPQRRPIVGTIMTSPGTFHLDSVPDGLYHLRVAALPFGENPLECLSPDAMMLVGCGEKPLLVSGGTATGGSDVALRLPRPTDPPVVVSLPAILLRRLKPQLERRSSVRHMPLSSFYEQPLVRAY